MVKKENFEFLSEDGKTKVHAVRWMREDGVYRAALQITHGMIEFIERYDAFAEFLCDSGFLVVGHDHIGHGESVASKEDWGYFAKDHPSDILVGDMHRLRTITTETNPDLPYFMMGHSMGSYMLRKYLALHGEGLAGAIIMGTGCVPDKMTKSGLFTVKILAKIFGWHHRSKFVQKLSFSGGYKRFDLTGTNSANSWLTKDEKIVDFYYHEPKCMFTFTLNGYQGLFEAVLFDNQPENIDAVPKELPMLLVSGADDPVGDFGKGVKRVYEAYRGAGVRDITCRLYEQDRHEILNETDRERIYQDILEWLNQHLILRNSFERYDR